MGKVILARVRAWLPWLIALACLLLFADEALAQSTGGSFGGGSFGGGGGGGSSGGGYSGGGDDGDGLISFIIYVLFSRLPWPLKIGLIVLAGGVFAAFKYVKRRRNAPPPDDDES